jgi:ribokinase
MMDLIIRAPRRPTPGETIVGHSFTTFLGGKGFNQAVASARAGASTAMIGRVGTDDYGRQFVEHLAGEGIDHSFVVQDGAEGTGIGLPLVEDSGENSIVIIPRANTRVSVHDVRAARSLIAGSDVLLLQFELPIDVACEAAALARAAGTRVIVNPAPAPASADLELVEALNGCVDILVPNMTEASQLTGLSPTAEAKELAEALRERFSCDVVVTLGDRGALVLDGDGAAVASPHRVPVVDTVGAGDAFCGAVGAWLATGATLRDAVRFGNAAGALAVGVAGAEPAMPARDAIIRQASLGS